jgi:hypothetical protein
MLLRPVVGWSNQSDSNDDIAGSIIQAEFSEADSTYSGTPYLLRFGAQRARKRLIVCPSALDIL